MNKKPENILKGMKDLYPDDHKYYTFLKKVFRHEFRKNGFRRISTPIIEKETLFKNAYLNDNDLLKGLYCFNDGEREVCLSSNATIGILRSYTEKELNEEIQPLYFYYMDKFLNKESELKEFHEIGCEIIGEKDPILDAQLMFIAYESLKAIGLGDSIKLKINTFGNQKEMKKFLGELKSFYENKKHILSPETLDNFEKNPLSIFSSKNEDEIILAKNVPKITKFLKKDSKNHFLKVKEYLDILGLNYKEDNTLILKDNYYDSVLWKIETIDGGDTLVYGGRYNSLLKKLGSEKEISSSGFKASIIDIIRVLRNNNIKLRNKDKTQLYFVQLGDEAKKLVLPLSLEARKAGINTLVSLGTPSMKEQILKSQRIGAKFVVMVGIMEARNGILQVRNTIEGTQEEVKKEDLINYITKKIGKENLDFYSPIKDLIKE